MTVIGLCATSSAPRVIGLPVGRVEYDRLELSDRPSPEPAAELVTARLSLFCQTSTVSENDVIAVDVGQFDNVDRSEDASAFVRWMEQQRRHGPDVLVDRLSLNSDSVVLDIGCGPGVDLAELGARSRLSVGIDRSKSMVARASARVVGLPAVAMHGDAQALPFTSGCFDACMARAVLIHTPDPESVVREIARVLKPASTVVLSEPDHGSHLVASPHQDVFERIKAHRRTQFRNPLIGRRLPDLVGTAGLQLDRSWAFPIVHRKLDDARAAGGPFDRAVQAAVEAGAITEREAEDYFSSLEELDQRGAFLFVAMAIAVEASTPSE